MVRWHPTRSNCLLIAAVVLLVLGVLASVCTWVYAQFDLIVFWLAFFYPYPQYASVVLPALFLLGLGLLGLWMVQRKQGGLGTWSLALARVLLVAALAMPLLAAGLLPAFGKAAFTNGRLTYHVLKYVRVCADDRGHDDSGNGCTDPVIYHYTCDPLGFQCTLAGKEYVGP